MAWHCKEVVRQVFDIEDPALAVEFVERLAADLQDESCPPELNQLGRTIVRWSAQIAAWHRARVSNGPTEAANNLIKPVKRVAFGFHRFARYRIRALLCAGRPNWALLTPLKREAPITHSMRQSQIQSDGYRAPRNSMRLGRLGVHQVPQRATSRPSIRSVPPPLS